MYLISIQLWSGFCKPKGLRLKPSRRSFRERNRSTRRFVGPSVDRAGSLYDHIWKDYDHAVIVIR